MMPRRRYSPLLGRLLHDRTADRMASVVSQIPHAAATIVPFDVRSRLEALHGRPADHPLKAVPGDGAAPSGPADGKKVPELAGQAQDPKPAARDRGAEDRAAEDLPADDAAARRAGQRRPRRQQARVPSRPWPARPRIRRQLATPRDP